MRMKEKIDTVGTLEGGIVFGREAAWNKLQQRLDQKPARKMALLPYSIAASLLIAVVIARLLPTHQAAPAVAVQPRPTPAAAQPAAAAPAIKMDNVLPAPAAPVMCIAPVTEIAAAQDNTPPPARDTILQPQVAVPAKPQFTNEVLHINDLDARAALPAWTAPQPQNNTMLAGTVHINEVEREQFHPQPASERCKPPVIGITFSHTGQNSLQHTALSKNKAAISRNYE